jgi:hypothetical protein
MSMTLLDYQELLRNLPQEQIVRLAQKGDPRSWMAGDELKRREEMYSAAAAEQSEQDTQPRNIMEEYIAKASGMGAAPPAPQGPPGMSPPGPMPQGPPMAPPMPQGQPMAPPMPAGPPQASGYAEGGRVGTEEVDWRSIPGMVSREHLIAHQRGYSGEGDWRFKGIPTALSEADTGGSLNEIETRQSPSTREAPRSRVDSFPEIDSFFRRAMLKNGDPTSEGESRGDDHVLSGGTFTSHTPEGEMDASQRAIYEKLLRQIKNRRREDLDESYYRGPPMPEGRPQSPGAGFQAGGPVDRLQGMGRGGDTQLMHVGPQEVNQMGTSINPQTGLPEAFPAIPAWVWGAAAAAPYAGDAYDWLKNKWAGRGGSPPVPTTRASRPPVSGSDIDPNTGYPTSPGYPVTPSSPSGYPRGKPIPSTPSSEPPKGGGGDASKGKPKKGFLKRWGLPAAAAYGLYEMFDDDEDKEDDALRDSQALSAYNALRANADQEARASGQGSKASTNKDVKSWQDRIRATAPGALQEIGQTIGQFGVGMGQSTGDALDAVTAGFQNALQVPEHMDVQRQRSLGAEANYDLALRELDYKSIAARAASSLKRQGKMIDVLALKKALEDQGDITPDMSEEQKNEIVHKAMAALNRMGLDPYGELIGRPTGGGASANLTRGVASDGSETQ